jgi:uncharacterized protein YndB with AHSA1/START domain
VHAVEQGAIVPAAPAVVFAYLDDPARRGEWDNGVASAALDGDRPGKGVRISLAGRRTAPSWTGEYTAHQPPKRLAITLVEGRGMPFSSYTETVEVAPHKGQSMVTLRIEYQATGPIRLIDGFTLRPRLRKKARRSLGRIWQHFS